MNIGRVATAMVAGAALSLAAAGCGSSGDGGNGRMCGLPPCGGDPVGNWTASSTCEDRATLSNDILAGLRGTCASLSVGDVSLTPTGTLTLGPDMTFTGALAVNATVDLIYAADCLGGASCAMLTQTLQTTVGTNGITSETCADTGSGTGSCTCTRLQTISIINATGTWATAGTMLTFAGAPGGNGPYCVQGSTLHLLGLDLATMTKVANDIVLTKQ